MTNQQKFIQIFGIDAWQQMIVFSGLADQFEEYWTSPCKETRWIPVSERLPEEDGQYIITVKYKHEEGYEDIYVEHGEWDNGKWDMFGFGHCGEVEKILAWMPLPEPYKTESEE